MNKAEIIQEILEKVLFAETPNRSNGWDYTVGGIENAVSKILESLQGEGEIMRKLDDISNKVLASKTGNALELIDELKVLLKEQCFCHELKCAYCKPSQISDEDIEKRVEDLGGTAKWAFKSGAKWMRQQLKAREEDCQTCNGGKLKCTCWDGIDMTTSKPL